MIIFEIADDTLFPARTPDRQRRYNTGNDERELRFVASGGSDADTYSATVSGAWRPTWVVGDVQNSNIDPFPPLNERVAASTNPKKTSSSSSSSSSNNSSNDNSKTSSSTPRGRPHLPENYAIKWRDGWNRARSVTANL